MLKESSPLGGQEDVARLAAFRAAYGYSATVGMEVGHHHTRKFAIAGPSMQSTPDKITKVRIGGIY